MITVTHTADYGFIRELITHPAVWKGASEDGLDRNTFIPSPMMNYFTFEEDDQLLGGAALRPMTSACAELHSLMLPLGYGRYIEAFNTLSMLLLEGTEIETLVAIIPETNKLSLSAAKKVGFEVVGIIPNSYRKNGRLVNQTLLEVAL